MKFVLPKDTDRVCMACLGKAQSSCASYSGVHTSAPQIQYSEGVSWFFQALEADARTVRKLGYNHFLQIPYPLIIVPFDAILSHLLTESLNNP
jgi:hypothetical protein